LPSGHINPGNLNRENLPPSKNGKLKRAPSCELLDQIGEMEKPNLLYNLDDYAKILYENLANVEIDEENKERIKNREIKISL